MPLIDQTIIKSLERPDGSHSQFALFLLGAVPQGHSDQPKPVPHPNWKERVLCTKVSKVRLRCIRGEAKRLARMKKNSLPHTPCAEHHKASPAENSNPATAYVDLHSRGPRTVASRLRALKRKLTTRHMDTMALIDEELEALAEKAQ